MSGASRPPVFVLGHRGMLGHVAARWFAERGHPVRTSDARYEAAPRDALVEAVRDSDARVVLNCLGRIKQKSAERAELLRANAVFPMHLARRLRPDQRLVHASSDCVFAGTRGAYRVDEEPDAADDYGFSKALGELVAGTGRATVVRVSIVGPEAGGGAGLLGWFLAQPEGRALSGFTNHRWNGITTLEWCRIVAGLVDRAAAGEPLPALVQPGTEPLTKHELLLLFRDVWGTGHRIDPAAAPEAVDRTLAPTDHRPPLDRQLTELREWYEPALALRP